MLPDPSQSRNIANRIFFSPRQMVTIREFYRQVSNNRKLKSASTKPQMMRMCEDCGYCVNIAGSGKA
jgi:hypothetical protein